MVIFISSLFLIGVYRRKQHLIVSYVLDLPFGNKQKYLNSVSPLANKFVGGLSQHTGGKSDKLGHRENCGFHKRSSAFSINVFEHTRLTEAARPACALTSSPGIPQTALHCYLMKYSSSQPDLPDFCLSQHSPQIGRLAVGDLQ